MIAVVLAAGACIAVACMTIATFAAVDPASWSPFALTISGALVGIIGTATVAILRDER